MPEHDYIKKKKSTLFIYPYSINVDLQWCIMHPTNIAMRVASVKDRIKPLTWWAMVDCLMTKNCFDQSNLFLIFVLFYFFVFGFILLPF